jgi:hypothetical protein
MKFKIITTTDNKYEKEILDLENTPLSGDCLKYKDLTISIDFVEEHNEIIKLVSSNYIIEMERI